MIRYAILMLSLLTFLLGCAQEVPLSRRDLEFARKDLELEREKYKTLVGSQEREGVDRQILDHRTGGMHFLIDEINSGEKRYPTVPIDEAARIKQINELIDKQLHGAQQPAKNELDKSFNKEDAPDPKTVR